MFRGVSHIAMDAKGRLAMPAKHRDRLVDMCSGQMVATVDIHSPCLLLYPLPTWEEIEQKIQKLPTFDPKVRDYQRLLIGYASDVELDGSGRFLLPPSLREYAGLDKKVVLMGQVNKFEVWNEDAWLPELKKIQGSLAEDRVVPEALKDFSL